MESNDLNEALLHVWKTIIFPLFSPKMKNGRFQKHNM